MDNIFQTFSIWDENNAAAVQYSTQVQKNVPKTMWTVREHTSRYFTCSCCSCMTKLVVILWRRVASLHFKTLTSRSSSIGRTSSLCMACACNKKLFSTRFSTNSRDDKRKKFLVGQWHWVHMFPTITLWTRAQILNLLSKWAHSRSHLDSNV